MLNISLKVSVGSDRCWPMVLITVSVVERHLRKHQEKIEADSQNILMEKVKWKQWNH